jgi:hypothetical protein
MLPGQSRTGDSQLFLPVSREEHLELLLLRSNPRLIFRILSMSPRHGYLKNTYIFITWRNGGKSLEQIITT